MNKDQPDELLKRILEKTTGLSHRQNNGALPDLAQATFRAEAVPVLAPS